MEISYTLEPVLHLRNTISDIIIKGEDAQFSHWVQWF